MQHAVEKTFLVAQPVQQVLQAQRRMLQTLPAKIAETAERHSAHRLAHAEAGADGAGFKC